MATMLIAVSCQESLEDRCAREAKEYNDKKCPAKVLDGVTIDSLVFDRSTHTLNYYYTFSGMSDNKEMISKINPRKILVTPQRCRHTRKPAITSIISTSLLLQGRNLQIYW